MLSGKREKPFQIFGDYTDDDGFMAFIDKDGYIVEWAPPGEDKPSYNFYSSEYNRGMAPKDAIAVMQIGKIRKDLKCHT